MNRGCTSIERDKENDKEKRVERDLERDIEEEEDRSRGIREQHSSS